MSDLWNDTSDHGYGDTPVPVEERLACTLWKCHHVSIYGFGDGSVTWWTLQPIERQWWMDTASRFQEALVANPDLLEKP